MFCQTIITPSLGQSKAGANAKGEVSIPPNLQTPQETKNIVIGTALSVDLIIVLINNLNMSFNTVHHLIFNFFNLS